MTIKEMLEIESSTKSADGRFAINYGRNQYGNRVGKAIAALVLNGNTVYPAQAADGFIVDGQYFDWKHFLPETQEGR